jgi:hypothetical protein
MADLTTLANVKVWLNLGQVTDTAAVPGAPPYTITVAKAAAWNGDAGVILTATGQLLQPVAADPGDGEYVAAGTYTFNAAQAGQAVSITYTTVSPQDPLLARLISAVSAWVESYLGRRIASQDYLEVRDGHGGVRLMFAQAPVTAVSLVRVDGREIPAAAAADQPGYIFSHTTLYLFGYQFTRGQANVELAYTAGYAATPPELEQAAIELATLRYKEREHIGQASASIKGEQVDFLQDLPQHLRLILDRYKKIIPV